MNKQQLAAKIWEAANKMRSKIEANEYKDYILGFIFYKFLSEKEVKYYAQELKQNTYNLTHMNLVMRGIEADNIVTRNGDTLEDNWPYFAKTV